MGDEIDGMAVDNAQPLIMYNPETTKQIVRDYIAHRLALDRQYRWPVVEEDNAAEGEVVQEEGEEHGAVGGRAPLDILPAPTVACKVMRGMGAEFEKMYREVFTEMCLQLEVTTDSAYPAFLTVSRELFSEGAQWGRIVALLSFGGSLSVRVLDDGLPQLIDSIAEWVAMYVDQNLATWIVGNGNWEAFVQFYGANPRDGLDRPWPTLKNFFCGIAAGAIGVLTISAFLSSRS